MAAAVFGSIRPRTITSVLLRRPFAGMNPDRRLARRVPVEPRLAACDLGGLEESPAVGWREARPSGPRRAFYFDKPDLTVADCDHVADAERCRSAERDRRAQAVPALGPEDADEVALPGDASLGILRGDSVSLNTAADNALYFVA